MTIILNMSQFAVVTTKVRFHSVGRLMNEELSCELTCVVTYCNMIGKAFPLITSCASCLLHVQGNHDIPWNCSTEIKSCSAYRGYVHTVLDSETKRCRRCIE